MKEKQTNIFRNINRTLGKAIHRYNMISDGDRILVGLSGGKDSLTLMWFLSERLPRVPIDYKLLAVYIDPGFDGGFAEPLRQFAEKMKWRLLVERTDYGIAAHGPENRENPCFLCSRLRRKRLFEIADEHGFHTLALGHHKDDIIETFFLNVCFAGEISTMLPSQTFFQEKFNVIRPLAYTGENTIRRFAKSKGFPEFENPCPSAGISKRRQIKQMLNQLYRSNNKIKGNIFRALHHVKSEYLLQ